ncbi:MAG: helix-turn-helix domain-containing protein [Vicinamibacterales bacterium]
MGELLTTVEACRLAGVGPTAIKRWADGGRLQCVRTAGGHRRFRRSELQALLRTLSPQPVAPREWDEWIDALLDREGPFLVEALLLKARATEGTWTKVAGRVGALLAEVGDRWARGSLTVAEEHVISDRLRRALTRVIESIPVPPNAPVCLLAAAEGDAHTGGLALTELTLREAGWRVIWAGAPMPVEELVAAIRRWQPRMVALSASVASKPSALLAEAARVAEACRAQGAVLALGGRGHWPAVPADAGCRFDDFESFAAFAASQASR